ncbi:MAG: Crp/Fnr family transcriptional regulator [Bacillota bacterium]|nr:Crp/Fnr family transcriptional regulator [Bacillota bacterium]
MLPGPDDFLVMPLFAHLDEAARSHLAAHARFRRFAKGSLVFQEAGSPDFIYVVISGKVRLFQTLADGREYTLEHLGPHETLGSASVFDGGPYPASAETLAPTLLMEIPLAAMTSLLHERPEVAVSFLRLFAQRMRRAHARTTDMALRTVHERLASIILQLWEDQDRHGSLHVSALQLAQLVGAARETITRALHDLQRQGALRLGRGKIDIADEGKLYLWIQR